MLSVFYDGRCGLCDREIAFYRRHAAADSVLWLDIWQQEAALLAAGLSQAQCLQQLHLLDDGPTTHRRRRVYLNVANRA